MFLHRGILFALKFSKLKKMMLLNNIKRDYVDKNNKMWYNLSSRNVERRRDAASYCRRAAYSLSTLPHRKQPPQPAMAYCFGNSHCHFVRPPRRTMTPRLQREGGEYFPPLFKCCFSLNNPLVSPLWKLVGLEKFRVLDK